MAVYQPLAGFKVVDLSSVVMGPFGTQILADLGAEVIVIEGARPDTNRLMGVGPHGDFSGTTINVMRNKRSVGLDFRQPAGYDVLLRLVSDADIVVTNLRPGSRRRGKITSDDLRAVKPDLIYCAAAGWPSTSLDADSPAYDDVIQGTSGIPDVMVRAGQEPLFLPVLIADKTVGMAIAQAVLAAVVHRLRTGEGHAVELAMTDVMNSYMLVEHGGGLMFDPPTSPAGYARILTAERRPYATKDGMVNVLPYSTDNYQVIFRAAGRDDLVDDPRIMTRRSRIDYCDELYELLGDLMLEHTTAEWMDLFRAHDVPAAEVRDVADLVDELPLAEHPIAGKYRVTRPITGPVDDDPLAVVRRPAPAHGENGREVLSEIGYTDDEIDALVAAGALFSPDISPPINQ